jgi:hypothetical protein
LRLALCLSLPFLWYAIGPAGGAFRVLARLPGFGSVELPMHGWFLPTLGVALLGGAGLLKLPSRWRAVVLGFVFVDTLVVNQIINPLAFARSSFDGLYGARLTAFAAQVASLEVPVERVYGAPLTAVGYRNHGLQSRVATTYGYNPLELASYAAYVTAADSNPRLVDGLTASLVLTDGRLESRHTALPLAYFAKRLTNLADDAAVEQALVTLDPAVETLVSGTLPPVAESDPRAVAVIVDRTPDLLTLHYRSATQSLLRVAVPSYPGWHATLGGRELKTISVDRALLGVVVPSGEGDIELRYTSRWWASGAAVSLLALATCGLAFSGVAINRRAPRAALQVTRQGR